MIDRQIKFDNDSNILRVKLRRADTGQGLTGLTSASAGLIISTICDNEAAATTYTQAGGTIEAVGTLGTYAAPTATKCRFLVVDAVNHPGTYEIHLADARFAVAASRVLRVSIQGAANLLERELLIELVGYDPVTGAVASVTGTVTLAANQLFIKKNAALANFEFPMFAAADHVTALTGLTITATRSIDGAAFAACANAAAEVGVTGIYKISLDATDLNGTVITLRFSGGVTADTTIITVVTQA